MNSTDDKILRDLYSPNVDIVIETIEKIREQGNSNYLPALIDLLNQSAYPEVKGPIQKILSELKQTDSIPFLIDAIENEKYVSIRQTLISMCWENGLNYTPYISKFIGWMDSGDYMTAFEAFTVIENLEYDINAEDAENHVHQLKQLMQSATSEKATLYHDLIHYIPSLVK